MPIILASVMLLYVASLSFSNSNFYSHRQIWRSRNIASNILVYSNLLAVYAREHSVDGVIDAKAVGNFSHIDAMLTYNMCVVHDGSNTLIVNSFHNQDVISALTQLIDSSFYQSTTKFWWRPIVGVNNNCFLDIRSSANTSELSYIQHIWHQICIQCQVENDNTLLVAIV